MTSPQVTSYSRVKKVEAFPLRSEIKQRTPNLTTPIQNSTVKSPSQRNQARKRKP